MQDDCLSEIEELIAAELKQGDYSTASKRIILRLRERFAKGAIYVSFDYQRRNDEIKRRYTKGNTRQLANEFGLSTRQISKIVNAKN